MVAASCVASLSSIIWLNACGGSDRKWTRIHEFIVLPKSGKASVYWRSFIVSTQWLGNSSVIDSKYVLNVEQVSHSNITIIWHNYEWLTVSQLRSSWCKPLTFTTKLLLWMRNPSSSLNLSHLLQPQKSLHQNSSIRIGSITFHAENMSGFQKELKMIFSSESVAGAMLIEDHQSWVSFYEIQDNGKVSKPNEQDLQGILPATEDSTMVRNLQESQAVKSHTDGLL